MKTKAHNVACVVVNWKKSFSTALCLTSILESDAVPAVIYVIDNHSSDGSIGEIQSLVAPVLGSLHADSRPEFFWIETLENIGYAAANNIV